MPVISDSRIYNKLSYVYDGLMKSVDFNVWTRYILDIAKINATKNSSFLELAAGTCRMAVKINTVYPDLIATDFSLPMMQIDKKNSLKKVCCSMLNLPFKTKFDFIYCTFDSINYLQTKKELITLFSEIESLLDGDGVFTFDASLENNSLEFTEEQVTEDKFDGNSFKRINCYDKEKRIHTNIFYIKNADGKKYKEVHKQKIYEFETYFNLINKAGLLVKECYDGFTFSDGSPESERVQFIIGKNKV
ncbi:MAG: methyltransferase domain-containing protein [Ignavibacteria bacterium]|nr:methyltransferase domain-containing protein [Ignavibacteria bacterium]MBT8384010.1 methyltransferase domain-containing protein [Ignavibacteria bacterium]MBT8393189.1 methyltransferase domain-containing protein [Ignavibacteria bacterium]NNJ51911.1 methyltransferase domain-containing protein [Ignavibacteriaceae bacterium]